MEANRTRTKELDGSKIDNAAAAMEAAAAATEKRALKHKQLGVFKQVKQEIDDKVAAINQELRDAEKQRDEAVRDRKALQEKEVVAAAEVARVVREVEAPLA